MTQHAKYVSPKNKGVTRYWLAFYCEDHCTLCGNTGTIDTTGTITPAGVLVGRVNYCICPNGQTMRQANIRIRGA